MGRHQMVDLVDDRVWTADLARPDLVLLVAPLAGIFAASGVGMAVGWTIAGQVHRRLGANRPSRGGQPAE